VEWGAFSSTARSKGFRFLIDCDVAETKGQHEVEGCLGRADYVRAILPDPYSETGRQIILDADEVVAHVGDGIHDWGATPMLERLDALGICPSGLLDSRRLTGLAQAYELLSLEGLAEQFGVMPVAGGLNDQQHGLVEAFSVIRAARNVVQDRRMKEIQAKG
jgi:hypothetical protein